MKAHYVSPNTSHMDNALSIDTIHLSIGHRLDPEMIKSWKYIKGARIRKINTPLGNIVLTYLQSKYNSTLLIELSAAKFLYGSNLSILDWKRLPELFAKVQCIVSNEIGIPELDICDFSIKRLDLCVDHIFSDESDANTQMTMMKNIFDSSVNAKDYYPGESYYIRSCKANVKKGTKDKAAVFKWYRKDLEIKNRIKIKKTEEDELPKKPIIRYELTLPNLYLRRLFVKDHVTSADIINCNPVKLFSDGLSLFNGDNLDLAFLDNSSLEKQRALAISGCESISQKRKTNYFFEAVKSNTSYQAKQFKKLISGLKSNGFRSKYNPMFRNFCKPNVIK